METTAARGTNLNEKKEEGKERRSFFFCNVTKQNQRKSKTKITKIILF